MSETELVFQSKVMGLLYLGSKDEFNTVVESIIKSQDEHGELVKVSGNYIAVSDDKELMTYRLIQDLYGIKFLCISGDETLSGRTFHSAVISFIISDNEHRRTLSFFEKTDQKLMNSEEVMDAIISGLKKSVNGEKPELFPKKKNKVIEEDDEDDEWI